MAKFSPRMDEDTEIKVPDLGAGSQSTKALFENIGAGVSTAIGITDNLIQEDIKREARDLFEEVNAPFQENLPTEFKKTSSQFSRLRQAYEQGKISDTAYHSKLVAGAKSLKAKYPGYIDEVDSIRS